MYKVIIKIYNKISDQQQNKSSYLTIKNLHNNICYNKPIQLWL